MFIANDQDRMLRAYDKADGRLLWEHEIPANPEGIPAVYAIDGRQYIAFSAGASWGTGGDPVWRNAFHRKPSETKAQGYYVFALPRGYEVTVDAQELPTMTRTLRLALIGAITARRAACAGSLGRRVPARSTRSRWRKVRRRSSGRRDALERVTWRTRTLVGDDRLTRWKLAVRPDGLGLSRRGRARRRAGRQLRRGPSRPGRSGGRCRSRSIARLTADEIAARPRRGWADRPVDLSRRARSAPTPPRSVRRWQLAKALGRQTVVVSSRHAAGRARRDRRGRVDIDGRGAGHARHAGRPSSRASTARTPTSASASTPARWLEAGRLPGDALATIGDRLRYLNLRDRAAHGPVRAATCRLGEGAGKLGAFFDELERRNVRPLAMTLDTTGIVSAPGRSVRRGRRVREGRAAGLRPALQRVLEDSGRSAGTSYTPARGETPDRGGDRATKAETHEGASRRRCRARPFAKPQKARTLLVIESLHGMSHNTIPHTNVMLERFGATTGAWKAVFSNDLTNLLPGKIDAYDAIFLNDIVGEAVRRSGGARQRGCAFVKNGGGLIGIHGTPWASRNWDEFTEMIGVDGRAAPDRAGHHARLRPRPARSSSRSTGKPLPFQEEYYRFHIEGARRLRWNNVRVLLTVDLDDPAVEPRPWDGYTRADKIYPVSWIRTYGQGRVFYTSIGHMPETFMTPALVGPHAGGRAVRARRPGRRRHAEPAGRGSVSAR